MKKFTSTLSVALIIVAILSACGHDIEDLQGTILGKVTDSSTGESLAGCIITITPGTTSRTTGSDGYFEFQDLTPQQYEIQVRKDGYHSDTKLITIVAGQTASGDIVCENQRASYVKKMEEQPKFAKEYNSKADNWETGRNICIGVAAGIYIYNIIDAVVAKGKKRIVTGHVKGGGLSFVPFATTDVAGVSLAYSF